MLLVVLLAGAVAASPYRWAGVLVVRKAIGLLPEVQWADVGVLIRRDLGFDIGRLARHGDPSQTLRNPFSGVEPAMRIGKELFADNCSKCHGAGATGGLGPALVGNTFKHGASDWALYHTITAGVPGTPMVGNFIPRADVWKVVAYLKGLEVVKTGGLARTGFDHIYTAEVKPAPEVSGEQLLQSSRSIGEWLLPWGSYDGQRYARDEQINTQNVRQLAAHWVHQLPAADAPNESTPVVSRDYLYVSQPPGAVYALDVKTGREIWRYTRPIPADIRVCCLATTRGVAVLGNRVYFGTLDAHMIALDASTGKVVWDQTVADYTEGYSIISPPMPIGDMVITGIAGGEYATQGFIIAYDGVTGHVRWRFDTIPKPDDPAAKTWAPKSLKAGAPTWGVGAYDPELNLLYWGVGCAAPDFNNAVRPGDNLYSSSMVALDPRTGKLVWYYQFLPGDDHDWDSIQTPSLIDVEQNGVVQKWLAVANRGGFFYVLDRKTGRFIRGTPFSKVTWATGLDPVTGRPQRAPNTEVTAEGTLLYPSLNGATNWWPSAYSPQTGLYYANVEEGAGLFYQGPAKVSRGKQYLGGNGTFGDDAFKDFVRAIDPRTGEKRWERENKVVTSAPRGGLLATAGGLLFGSDGPRLYALDTRTGEELWGFEAGSHISAPPITYRWEGRQYIAVVAGQNVLSFALPDAPTPAPPPPAKPVTPPAEHALAHRP